MGNNSVTSHRVESGTSRAGKVAGLKRVFVLMCMPEPQFLLPGSVPVVVGSAMGFAAAGSFDFILAVLALVSIVLINAGSNMLNDYFDHLSGNDWLNDNVTPFGGGSRYIQNGIVTPGQMLAAGIGSVVLGACAGLVIVWLTGSMFILALGITGVLGGVFWTAGPVKFCYRFIGEPYIFTLFGPLPVAGAYYLQTAAFDPAVLVPGVIIGIVIALVAEINSFPDAHADAAVNKRTFVVRYGIEAGIRLYRVSLSCSYFIAVAGIFLFEQFRAAGVLYLLTLPVGIFAMKLAGTYKTLEGSKSCAANKLTIAYHSLTGLAMTAGFLVQYFVFTGTESV